MRDKLLGAALLAAFLLVQSMDYQDQVEQHNVKCKSATYVADNKTKC